MEARKGDPELTGGTEFPKGVEPKRKLIASSLSGESPFICVISNPNTPRAQLGMSAECFEDLQLFQATATLSYPAGQRHGRRIPRGAIEKWILESL